MINLIYGFTGTLKVSENISLSDISSLMHTKQFENFDGRTRTDRFCFKKQPANFFCRTYLFFSDVNSKICKLLRLLNK
jgi:hypothetical protein